MEVFYAGDLGCETIQNTSAANCFKEWYAENAKNTGPGDAARDLIESYVYTGKVYPYNGGHPKHPMKFSTNSNYPRSRINKQATDWYSWVEPYYFDIEDNKGLDFSGKWTLTLTDNYPYYTGEILYANIRLQCDEGNLTDSITGNPGSGGTAYVRLSEQRDVCDYCDFLPYFVMCLPED